MTNVTEDCSQQAEYCQYNFRTQEVTQQTIICQRPTEMVTIDDHPCKYFAVSFRFVMIPAPRNVKQVVKETLLLFVTQFLK